MRKIVLGAGMGLMLILAGPVVARERSEIPVNLTWNLNEIYPSTEAWQKARADLAARIPHLATYKGHLGDSTASLEKAFEEMLSLRKELDRLQAYASLLSDQDTRISENLALTQAGEQLAVQFDATQSYIGPELLAVGNDKVQELISASPKLKVYQPYFHQVFRMAPHTLGPAEEKIIARAGDMATAGDSIRGIFANADMPYPEVTLSTGEKVRLDAAGYTRYRALPNRADRLLVFQAFFGCYKNFTRTFGTTLYAQVKAHEFDKDVRNYDSALQAALFPNEVPTSVYDRLLKDVHANLGTLHRYLKLRQRLMGLDQLGYEDLYAPIIKGVDLQFTPEQADELTLKATAPLGPEYTKVLSKAYKDRWVDLLPSTGKRSGAYSNGGAYDVHPYQLLNYNGGYEDLSTLAHESGHSIHSYLSNTTQPFGLHDYPIFVAEVASTLNENLLLHYMLENTKDDDTKLFLLGSYLENLRGTLFRQSLLAEFELEIHKMAESGESLTGDNLTALYLRLLKEYYGDAQGVCEIDDLYGVEWAYIPHFYYNFYVYQYATSIVASTSLAEHIRTGGDAARDDYLAMLSAGASKDPITLLKDAGVDMTTSAPFNAAMTEMNRVMDQMEAILAKKGTK